LNDNQDISQELLEAIERYISGAMEAKELKDFNEYLKIDDEFKTQVEDIKTMLLGIETQSLKERLDIFHEDIKEAKAQESVSRKIRFINYRKLSVAAAILIVIGSIWFFSDSPNRRLYVKYFKPDPGLPTTMGSGSNNFDFYYAMVNYKHGDYDKAIEKWKTLKEKKPNNDTINYFLGVAHLANKNEAEAIPFLERAVENSSFSMINDAYYYLGLAYLNVDNVVLAKKYLGLSNTDISKELIGKLN
jgi:tetratricopeptide (TPR) repeat protein